MWLLTGINFSLMPYLVLCISSFLAICVVWMITRRAFASWNMTMPRISLASVYLALRPATIRLAIVCVSFTIGFLYRDALLLDRMHTLFNLSVIAKHDRFRYRFKLGDDPTPWDTEFCKDYVPTFETGDKLEYLTYEDKGNCWEIGEKVTPFKYANDDNGNGITAVAQEKR